MAAHSYEVVCTKHRVQTLPQGPQPQPAASSTTALGKQLGANTSSSSREQVPMPHPILKKTRGPSHSGPKPTTRFVLPDDEEDTSSDNMESPNAHVVVVPPSAPSSPPESQVPHAKRTASFTANRKKPTFTAHKKKRPVMVKRHSSASSTDSSARVSDASQFSAMVSSADQTPPSFAAQSRMRPQSRFQENFSPSSGPSPKKPEPPRSNGTKHVSPRKLNGTTKRGKNAADEVVSSRPASHGNTARSAAGSNGNIGLSTAGHRHNPVELNPSAAEIEQQRALLEEANARVEIRNQQAIKLIEQSHAAAQAKAARRSSGGGGSSHAYDLLSHKSKSMSTVSLAPTLASPTGQLDLGGLGDSTFESSSLSSRPSSPVKADKGKGRDPEDLRRTAMFIKRQVTPQAAVSGSLPATPEPQPGELSRSKSQLTLLLEKDRALSGGKGKEIEGKDKRDKKGKK